MATWNVNCPHKLCWHFLRQKQKLCLNFSVVLACAFDHKLYAFVGGYCVALTAKNPMNANICFARWSSITSNSWQIAPSEIRMLLCLALLDILKTRMKFCCYFISLHKQTSLYSGSSSTYSSSLQKEEIRLEATLDCPSSQPKKRKGPP